MSSPWTVPAPLRDTAMHVLAAYIGFHLIQSMCHTFFPTLAWDTKHGAGFSRRVGSVIGSYFHCIFVSAMSIYFIAQCGFMAPATTAIGLPISAALNAAGEEVGPEMCAHGVAPRSLTRPVLAVSMAFFMYDFVDCLPNALKHPADMLHHALGLVLTGACLVNPVPASLGQHILITELSTPLFNANFLLKKFLPDHKRAYMLCGTLFALVFFLTRPIYLTWVTGIAWVSPSGMASFIGPAPVVGVAMLILTVLNFYWFYKILMLVVTGWGKLDKESGGEAADDGEGAGAVPIRRSRHGGGGGGGKQE